MTKKTRSVQLTFELDVDGKLTDEVWDSCMLEVTANIPSVLINSEDEFVAIKSIEWE